MMNETPAPILPPPPLLPQHIITSGTRKDCVRLRGLPYEAQVENILEFLGEHAKNIVFQGVHMVYNAQVSLISEFIHTIPKYFKVFFFCKRSLNEKFEVNLPVNTCYYKFYFISYATIISMAKH